MAGATATSPPRPTANRAAHAGTDQLGKQVHPPSWGLRRTDRQTGKGPACLGLVGVAAEWNEYLPRMGPAPGWVVHAGPASPRSPPGHRGADDSRLAGSRGRGIQLGSHRSAGTASRHREPIAADRQHPPTLIFPKQNDRDRVSTEEAIALEVASTRPTANRALPQVDAAGLGCHAP